MLDLGTDSAVPEIDYVSKAHEMADAIVTGRVERGVLVASSGVGSSFAANKIEGIRAGACSDTYTTLQGVAGGMNILCLGSGTVDKASAAEIVAAFARGPRYVASMSRRATSHSTWAARSTS